MSSGQKSGFYFFLAVIVIISIGLVWIWQNRIPSRHSDITSETSMSADTTTSAAANTSTSVQEPLAPKPSHTMTEPSETQKYFSQLVTEFKKNLPTQADLQKLTAQQAHYTPGVILHSASDLGEIAQAIADHKELVPEGLQFYRECAETSTSPNSVRASCLANHEELLKSSGSTEASLKTDDQISDRVKKLAAKL